MTSQPNEPLAIPHDGRKPDWLDDLDRVFKDAEGMTFVFARSSIWKGDYFLPADHWASPVLRLRASTGKNWVPWNAKLQGDGPPKDYALDALIMLRNGKIVDGVMRWTWDNGRVATLYEVIGYIATQPREEHKHRYRCLSCCDNKRVLDRVDGWVTCPDCGYPNSPNAQPLEESEPSGGEMIEVLARALFEYDEGHPIGKDTLDFWFRQTSESFGENHDCWQHCEELRKQARFLLERLPPPTDALLEKAVAALEPFAEVAQWAERNGKDLLGNCDMLLRYIDTGQFAGHLHAQSKDFIRAATTLDEIARERGK
jgi:hypothetical protein